MNLETLVKFGRPDHVLALRQKGIVYLNTLQYHSRLEEGSAAGAESAEQRLRRGRGSASYEGTAGGGAHPASEVGGWEFRVPAPDAGAVNVFCMYALRPAHGSFPVDERNFRFGESALVLLEPRLFLDRAREALRRAGMAAVAGLVRYVEDDRAGELGPLCKRAAHAYESEWRIVCNRGPGCAIALELGDLSEISCIVPSVEINRALQTASGPSGAAERSR